MRGLLALLVSVIFISSCKILSPTIMFETEKEFQYTNFKTTPEITVIQPYDQIQILMVTNYGTTLLENSSIFQSSAGVNQYNNQSGNNGDNYRNYGYTYMIRPDSTVKLPMIGYITLGGIEKDSAELILEKELGKFYQEPFVRITIVNRNVIMFFEEGTVGHVIQIPEDGITLLDAIAQLGGLTENSKAFRIKLIRGDNKNPQVYNFNIRSLEEFKKANFVLEANDIIYVDSRPRYLQKVLNEMQPYLVLMSTGALVYSIFN